LGGNVPEEGVYLSEWRQRVKALLLTEVENVLGSITKEGWSNISIEHNGEEWEISWWTSGTSAFGFYGKHTNPVVALAMYYANAGVEGHCPGISVDREITDDEGDTRVLVEWLVEKYKLTKKEAEAGVEAYYTHSLGKRCALCRHRWFWHGPKTIRRTCLGCERRPRTDVRANHEFKELA